MNGSTTFLLVKIKDLGTNEYTQTFEETISSKEALCTSDKEAGLLLATSENWLPSEYEIIENKKIAPYRSSQRIYSQ